MKTLKSSLKEGDLESFICDREKIQVGDEKRLNKTLNSFVQGKSKSTQETSKKESS